MVTRRSDTARVVAEGLRLASRPVPRSVGGLMVVAAAGVFGLAWWTAGYPFTYCDSQGWAPSYLGQLFGGPIPIARSDRGWLVPAYFDVLGGLSMRFGAVKLIGLVQGGALLASLLWMSARLARGAVLLELALLPALLFSFLRYAIYGQTILSEPLTIILCVPVWLLIMRERLGVGAAAGAAAGAALAGSLRPDNLYLAVLVVARVFVEQGSWRRRLRDTALAVSVMLVIFCGLASVQRWVGSSGYPRGEVMVVAEWLRYTEPPHNRLARRLDFNVTRALAPVAQAQPMRTIYDGLGAAQQLYAQYPAGWLPVARLLAYQAVNRPLDVFADRLAVLADLYATAYAALWTDYRSWSAYYSAYDGVFGRWRPDQLKGAACPTFAILLGRFCGCEAIRSPRGLETLVWLHRLGRLHSKLWLRSVLWLALPACLLLLWRRRTEASYVWLTLIIAAHLGARGLLMCADERYQLPVDLLMVWWVALTFRGLLRTAVGSVGEMTHGRESV